MEDVVFGCFLLFPHKFGLKKYPRWPDSAVVGRRMSDCRGKGYIAANTEFGFKLTVKGIRVAERVAKALGVAKPKPKVIATPPPELNLVTPPPAPEKKVKTPAPEKPLEIVEPIKKAIPVKRKKPVERAQAVQLALVEEKKAESVPTPKPVQAVEKKPAAPKKIAKTEPAILPTVIIQPIRVEKAQPAQISVSREEKARAGKFIRSMEGSDAYRLYRKNGGGSKISEFDFRSLLLCTMESSGETLARNLELFKGYARIQSREDMLQFLNHCGEYFSSLLKTSPEKKTGRKK